MIRITEPDRAKCRRAEARPGYKPGRAGFTALLILLCLGPLSPAFAEPADSPDMETALRASGINYPEGFDPNTVGEVRGKSFDLYRPEKSGPVRFRLVSERETYTVLLCPPWYWNDLGEALPDGTHIKVVGSKTLGRDGKLYIIAQETELTDSGKVLSFRRENGLPLWRGFSSRKSGGMRGGAGSPMRGTGGGMHRGGRR